MSDNKPTTAEERGTWRAVLCSGGLLEPLAQERLLSDVVRLQAIADLLPKTADGVTVTPDMEIWLDGGRRHDSKPDGPHHACMALDNGDYYSPTEWDFGETFSTKEAAEAAAKGKK